jgi:hypothetical protein
MYVLMLNWLPNFGMIRLCEVGVTVNQSRFSPSDQPEVERVELSPTLATIA